LPRRDRRDPGDAVGVAEMIRVTAALGQTVKALEGIY
jgi:hypothetical protein